jgi:uncharacterized protein
VKYIGTVTELYRYPVKSMAGEQLKTAQLDWTGIVGDRRYALRRIADTSGFPWLTAGRCAALLRYTPYSSDAAIPDSLPTHIRTPEGHEYGILDGELAQHIQQECGAPVEMFRYKHGIFDEAPLSLITSTTVQAIASASDTQLEVRRFRPNMLLDTEGAEAFGEDSWLGQTMTFGEGPAAPQIVATIRDLRCSMVNLHPDTAIVNPQVLRAVVRLNGTHAGIYATVTRVGTIAVGANVFLG